MQSMVDNSSFISGQEQSHRRTIAVFKEDKSILIGGREKSPVAHCNNDRTPLYIRGAK